MSTLYLCIAYAPDVDAGAATLSNEDTVWVAIEPSTTVQRLLGTYQRRSVTLMRRQGLNCLPPVRM